MGLIIIWTTISITIGFFFKLSNTQYILLSFIMLCITYVYNNKLNPTTMSLKNAIILSIVPNTYFWYLAYHCNNFLWVYPYEWCWFILTFLIYSYILIYIVCEC